jgi:hypothetical protein
VKLPEDATVLPAGTIISDAGNGFISPLVLLEQDNGGAEDTSKAVWLQTSFFVGSGDNKGSSFINIALGEWSAEDGITGARRGGSIVLGENAQTYSFSGDIASLDGPDGSGTDHHFMGTDNPNIVIGFDSTGSHNIGRDNPLNPTDDIENQSGATYHVGIGSGPVQPVEQQTLVALKGFAAGFAQDPQGNSDIVANFSPSDVTLNFDAATNTMTSAFKLKQITPSALGAIQAALNLSPQFNLGFGGNGRSAFLGDNTFAAIEAEEGSSVDETVRSGFLGLKTTTYRHPASVEGFLVSADAIAANQVLFGANDDDTPKRQAFCQNCDFIKWGAWGARVDYQQQNQQTATADVQLGWWIAGDIVSKNDMPFTGSAYYSGDAIGNVINDGTQYTATGDMSMDWNFGRRSGTLTISDFDTSVNQGQGIAFSGRMVAPGVATFSGAIGSSDLGGLVGAANGAFVGSPGHGQIPQGVIGNFGIANSTYQATGIFGGVAQPH